MGRELAQMYCKSCAPRGIMMPCMFDICVEGDVSGGDEVISHCEDLIEDIPPQRLLPCKRYTVHRQCLRNPDCEWVPNSNSCRERERCTNTKEDRVNNRGCGYSTKLQPAQIVRVQRNTCSACDCQTFCGQGRKKLEWTYRPSRAVCQCVARDTIRQVKNVVTNQVDDIIYSSLRSI